MVGYHGVIEVAGALSRLRRANTGTRVAGIALGNVFRRKLGARGTVSRGTAWAKINIETHGLKRLTLYA